MSGYTIALLIGGLGLLVVGAELLVRGAARLGTLLGLSPLIIGLTVVAYGTSAPELAVSVKAAMQGQGSLALGNVVGSNIFNILMILGVSALVVPLTVSERLVRLDVPVMLAVTLLMAMMGLDGAIGRGDGLILFGGAVCYTAFLIIQGRRQTQEEQGDAGAAVPSESRARRALVSAGLVALGLGLLVQGAEWLVGGAVALAKAWGVSEMVIGLTIVAAGTSLPELATSVVAGVRGQRDIAVGNVVGSNIFNILTVLGVSAALSPAGVSVPAAAMRFDIPVAIAAALACLPIFFTGARIARWEGGLFLLYYLAYVVYLVLSATGSGAASPFALGMGAFVIPLTLITLSIVTFRAFWAKRRRR